MSSKQLVPRKHGANKISARELAGETVDDYFLEVSNRFETKMEFLSQVLQLMHASAGDYLIDPIYFDRCDLLWSGSTPKEVLRLSRASPYPPCEASLRKWCKHNYPVLEDGLWKAQQLCQSRICLDLNSMD